MNKKVIAHLTSAHSRTDIRIFLKMCKSTAIAGFKTYLIVADGLGDELIHNVKIIDSGIKKGGRIRRMTVTSGKIYFKAKLINADIYHLHDPELIPVGLALKRFNKKIIFDAHEDLPKQIMSKPYLGQIMKFFLSNFFKFFEKYSCSRFDAVIGATPMIQNKFQKINIRSININNYPLKEELAVSVDQSEKLRQVTYAGSISEIRGIKELVSAMEFTTNVQLNIAGSFNNYNFEKEIKKMSAWNKVNFLGHISRNNLKILLSQSVAGIVTFLPLPNHLDSQPNKMFEYMSAGLPIITSNFSLWKEIVEENNCGICVDPTNPKEIGEAIQYLIDNPALSKSMGENGRQAVNSNYSWDTEQKKLINLYSELNLA